MVVLKSACQPYDLAAFSKTYLLREFDALSNECLG